MYLSRLFLNTAHNRRAAQDADNAYGLHQRLRWAFADAGEPHGPLPADERLLWRDDGPQGLLFQSVARPDWQAAEDRWPGYFDAARVPQVKAVELELHAGDTLFFRLRANVTVNRFRDGQDRADDPRTRREAVRGASEQVAWLHRQGERGGFAVLGTDILQSGNVRLFKRGGGAPMTLFGVTFEGLLRVEDSTQFQGTLRGGVGKAKALGFGLLSVSRASR